MVQLVKNLPAMWETWVPSLGWEDPLEKGKATHSSILAWRIPWTVYTMGLQRDGHEFEQALGVGDGQGSLVSCSPWGPKEPDTTERLN